MNRIIKCLLFILSVAFFITPAEAEWYTDCPACAQHLGGSGKAGPFSSEDECNNFKSSYPNNTYPYGDCYSTGDTSSSSDSGTSSDGSLTNDASQLIVGGLMHNDGQALGLGLMGLGVNMMLQGSQTNPQQEAEQQAQEAAQAAEEKRQAEERARQRELIKEQLLGEAPSGGGSTGGLHLMGVTQEANLQLMTGNQALAPMTTTLGKKKVKHSDAYNKGYHDASQCYQEHPVTACSSISDSTAYLTCRNDYYAGYEVGAKEEKMKIDEATKLGMLDAEDGKPNNGFNVTNDTGDCRDDLDMAYSNGYSQIHRPKTSAGSAR